MSIKRAKCRVVVEEGGQDVTAEMTKAYLGVFKISRASVDTKWKFGVPVPNRPLDQARIDKLKSVFVLKKERLERTNPAHRMESLVSGKDWTHICGAQGWDENVKSGIDGDVKDWPVGMGQILELAAGQHRFELLKQIYKDPKEHWWWSNVYIADGLSDPALRRLRSNKPTIQNFETASDLLVTANVYDRNVVNLKQKIIDAQNRNEPTTELKEDLAGCEGYLEEFTKSSLGSRMKQIHAYKPLNKVLCDLFEFPGLRLNWNPSATETLMKRRVLKLLIALLKDQLTGWTAVAAALKLEPADVDSTLVKVLCKCAPLRQSSDVSHQENIVDQIPQAAALSETESQLLQKTIHDHAPLLTPKDFFKPQAQDLRSSLCSYSDLLSVIAVMSRGNGIVGPTGNKGKATHDKEDAYEAVSRSIPDDPGLRETILAYLAVQCHLPIPKVNILTNTMDDIDPPRRTKKKREPKGGWILSKQNTAEAKVFVEMVTSHVEWLGVIGDLTRMGWSVDPTFQQFIDEALEREDSGKSNVNKLLKSMAARMGKLVREQIECKGSQDWGAAWLEDRLHLFLKADLPQHWKRMMESAEKLGESYYKGVWKKSNEAVLEHVHGSSTLAEEYFQFDSGNELVLPLLPRSTWKSIDLSPFCKNPRFVARIKALDGHWDSDLSRRIARCMTQRARLTASQTMKSQMLGPPTKVITLDEQNSSIEDEDMSDENESEDDLEPETVEIDAGKHSDSRSLTSPFPSSLEHRKRRFNEASTATSSKRRKTSLNRQTDAKNINETTVSNSRDKNFSEKARGNKVEETLTFSPGTRRTGRMLRPSKTALDNISQNLTPLGVRTK